MLATNGFFRPLIVESDLEAMFMINDEEPYFPSKGIIEDEIRLLMEAVQIFLIRNTSMYGVYQSNSYYLHQKKVIHIIACSHFIVHECDIFIF